MSYETGTASSWVDLLKKIHTYLTDKGTAFGLEYTGTGDGELTDMRGGASSVAETFTLTATSATNFTVTGSVSGALAAATVGTPYATAEVEFLINAGGVAFIAGDEFIFSTAPPWVSKRAAYGTKSYSASFMNTGSGAAPNAFDACGGAGFNEPYRIWGSSSGASFPVTLEIEYYEAETIAEYALQAGPGSFNTTWAPKDFKLQYWNGSAWTDLDTQTNQIAWGFNEIRSFTIASPVSATRYRLNISAAVNASGLYLAEWYMRRTAGGFNTLPSQVILQAPGNDGNSEINCGIRQFYRLDGDYFNLHFVNFDGFIEANEFNDQPGISKTAHFMPLLDANMTYWIAANGRGVRVVAKVQTQYEMGMCGGYDSDFPPNELALPLCNGGSMHSGQNDWPWGPNSSQDWSNPSFWRYDQNVSRHAMPSHSDPGNGSDSGDASAIYRTNLAFRRFDGSWGWVWASRGKSYASFTNVPETNTAVLWPLSDNPDQIDPNFDGSYMPLPLQMFVHGPINPMGQLDGMCWVTGQGISAESLINDGARKFIVFPDINRNTRQAFFGLELT